MYCVHMACVLGPSFDNYHPKHEHEGYMDIVVIIRARHVFITLSLNKLLFEDDVGG